MILLSTLNIIGLLINGNSLSWLWNMNLTHEKLDWDRKWLPDFSAGKTQLVSFDRSNNCGAIDEKKDCSVLDEKLSFTILYLCLVNWTAVFKFSLLTKLTLRNWSLIHSTKFLPRFCFIFTNLPSYCAWDTITLPGLMHPIATWICLIFVEVLLVFPMDCMIFLSLFLDVKRMSMSTVSFPLSFCRMTSYGL